uniref:CSON001374 protein n=1 Tax=Culicoides sonorensis TaxID=179676 RepID=A0A336MH81_CULSO
MSDQNQTGGALPKHWVQRVSKSRNGKQYFFNTKTRESVWKFEDIEKSSSQPTKFSGGKSHQNNVSPDKKLRKIQSATNFKSTKNIAESRLKHLQANLKKEQMMKEVIARNGKIPNSHTSKSDETQSHVLLSNNNNNNVTTQSEKQLKFDSAFKNEPDVELSAKYREFVSQIMNNSSLSANQSTENTGNGPSSSKSNQNEFEEMDWEDSNDISTNSKESLHNSSKNVDLSLDSFETMEQYLNYKNLINDEEIDQKYFNVVVDTNVFLSNLEFIERLIKINFKNYGSPIIVVPYIVLQELDNIKSRFESKFMTLSVKAKSAISFLNEKFKDHHKQFCGQSAKDDATKLISIKSQDDDIVNCLLQVKERVKNNVILLSNDRNLRNKVMVTGINAYSTTELEAKKDDLKIFIEK